QFAHERNVVHRDIKPANLMLAADDTVKITDFGTAKILQFGSTQQTSHVMGTPSYMSPEQVKGRGVDGRSDIFSLGVMLYEMITGEKPFPGQNITTVIYKIVNEEPVPPRQIDASIHPGISTVVLKALAKEPEQRYQSCREMLEDLRNYRAQGFAGASPNSTMVIGGGSPAATVASGNLGGHGFPGHALSGHAPATDDPTVVATSRSPRERAAAPWPTPVVPRTGTMQSTPDEAPTSARDTVAEVKSADPSPEKAAPRRPDNAISPKTAEYKGRIEEAISEKGLGGGAKVQSTGNTLTLVGKLRPSEHAELLKFLRSAPASVHVIDHIEYDDAAASAGAGSDDSSHPLPAPGRGAIHV